MNLADALTLRSGTILPNRLVKGAMTEALSDGLSRPTPELCRLYERWSLGGTGTLITGNVQVDRRYQERPGNVCIDGPQDAEQLQRLRTWAAAAQTHGSKVFVQLSHAGRQTNGMINLKPVGPGDVPLARPHQMPGFLAAMFYGRPSAMSLEEVQGLPRRFADAAQVCKDCGFDGVQVHSAHGYLLSSFLNPLANNRDQLFGAADPYGGALESRSRLLLEIVRSVRERVGGSFPISVKLNSADFQQGGFTTKEAVQVAVWLEQEGIDFLEISGGNYEAGIYGEKADPAGKKLQSTKRREAYFLEYAVEVTSALSELPVMVTGGWRTRVAMLDALQKGECKLFGLGRPLCGDPDCSKKLLDGSIDELPRYESTLSVGYWPLRPLMWVLPRFIAHVVQLGSTQAWYYRNIVQIALSGTAHLGFGPFVSFLWNMKREAKLAGELRGVDCSGTITKAGR